VVPVGGQDGFVGGQPLFPPVTVGGGDQGVAAQRDAAGLGEPGADRAVGEVRLGRGLLPPAGRAEVGLRTHPAFDAVLGLAVAQNVDIAVVGVDEEELAGRIILVVPALEQQRVHAVAAEADVDQPGAGAVGGAHDQGHVVEGDAELAVAVDPGRDPGDLAVKALQEQGERPVELVADAAAGPVHDLVDQIKGGHGDRLVQVHAQVLERHHQLVGPVQDVQGHRIGGQRPRNRNALQIRAPHRLVHESPPSGRGT
jgi:hypothetical protein